MKERDYPLDILKSIAIMLMSFVHINSLLQVNSGILDKITFLGATVCFSVFLFGIGFVAGKKITNGEKDSWKKVLHKILLIYVCYLVIGIASYFISKGQLSFVSIYNIAILNNLPEYSEFLISLIFFTLLTQLIHKPLQKHISKPYLLIEISILLFIVGSILSTFELSNSVLIWLQKHLVGSQNGTHVFPILQYMPIYVMGILFAKYRSKIVYFWVFSLSFLLLVILMALGAPGWYRWPPSLNFLLYGVIFISLLMFAFQFVKRNRIIDFFNKFGRNPLLSVALITIPSFVLAYFLNTPIKSDLILWGINLGVLLFASITLFFLKK